MTIDENTHRGWHADFDTVGYEGRRLGSFSFTCQWLEWIFFRHYSWHNFSFLTCQVEYDPIGPQFEVELGLCGFWFRAAAALPWTTERSRQLADLLADIKSSPEDIGEIAIPLADLRQLRTGEIDASTFEYAGDTYTITKS